MFRPKSVVQCPSNATVISSLRGCFPRSAGKDVITRLLDKKESTRLGSKSGASEVKQHKWFAKINWGLLRNTQPPVSFPPFLDQFGMRGRGHCGHVLWGQSACVMAATPRRAQPG